MSAAQEVLFEVRGAVAILTINRPDQRNALNIAVGEQLIEGFRRFDADPTLRVAILTGAGDRAFSSGRDLKEIAERGDKGVPPLPTLGENLHVNKPVIAAVNGFAIAGGWLYEQMCDLCIAAETAQFAITEGRVGRGFAWSPPLVHMLGSRIAMEMLLTGRMIDAQRAYEIGFVNRVVPYKDLIPSAIALAEEICASAPLSVAMARQIVRHTMNMGLDAALETGRQISVPVYASDDAKEGAKAFKEKRKPKWKGR